MDALIVDIDDSTYRAARARAALESRSVGEVVTEALRNYLARTTRAEAPTPFLDWPSSTAEESHTETRVDEVVFLYCI